MKKTDKKNRGFTLVEMIVTVAIVAVFSTVVLTATGAGARLYRSVSGNTQVQMNTQQLAEDMETLIVNAGKSIYYAYGTGDAPGSPILNDIDGGTSGDKTLLLATGQENGDGTASCIVNVLDWKESEKKIYYSKKKIGASSGVQILTEPSVYAEGVKNFQADVSEVKEGKQMRFQLTMENQGKEITTLYTVNLRNPVKISLPEVTEEKEGGQSGE